jgi:hypothetical protein
LVGDRHLIQLRLRFSTSIKLQRHRRGAGHGHEPRLRFGRCFDAAPDLIRCIATEHG